MIKMRSMITKKTWCFYKQIPLVKKPKYKPKKIKDSQNSEIMLNKDNNK
jgi:hypothetical protein